VNVLAIDCSTAVLAVALRSDEGWAEASLDLGLRHAERLMELVDFCMSRSGLVPADLDLVACSLGPGSFTGLRIGMATTKGIALGLGKPWVAVPTLDCLAWGLLDFPGAVAPIVDGRKGRVFSAIYEGGKRVSGPLDLPLARLAALLDTYSEALITGPSAELFAPLASERPGFRIDRRAGSSAARALACLGAERFEAEGGSPPGSGPLYMRQSEAEESLRAALGSGGGTDDDTSAASIDDTSAASIERRG
jgi:tRNA threonylcarbamoyladenosine biosynthesis protein TsaB